MAGLACPSPVFDELLDNEQSKDTEVIIVEEGSSPAADTSTDSGQEARRKRSRLHPSDNRITLAAHWVVLYSLSPYFKAKIERWSHQEHASKRLRQQHVGTHKPDQPQQQPSTDHDQPPPQQVVRPPFQYSLQLLVPPGQLELGRRLITAMYSSSPDLSDLTAPQLMQLAALAECYGVGKVAAAIAVHLQQLTVDTMPLDTAVAVFELPEACLLLPAFKSVRQTAAAKLQQELGDLEVVWRDTSKRAQLLGLPFVALLQLLGDKRTRVASGSEDTVVYTAAAWLGRHPGATRNAAQLLAVLRLPHCTATYFTSSYIRRCLVRWGVSEEQLIDLAAMPALTAEQRTGWLVDVYEEQKAWQLPRRPASAIGSLQWAGKVQLAKLKAALEQDAKENPQDEGGTWRVPARHVGWHGRAWEFGVYASTDGGFGAYLQVEPLRASCDVTIELAGIVQECTTAWTLPGVYVADMMHGQLLCEAFVGSREGAPVTWAQLRGRLEEEGLVHAGDALHLSCTVTAVA